MVCKRFPPSPPSLLIASAPIFLIMKIIFSSPRARWEVEWTKQAPVTRPRLIVALWVHDSTFDFVRGKGGEHSSNNHPGREGPVWPLEMPLSSIDLTSRQICSTSFHKSLPPQLASHARVARWLPITLSPFKQDGEMHALKGAKTRFVTAVMPLPFMRVAPPGERTLASIE